MLVANKLVLEFKTVPDINDSHVRQLLTYLEASIYEACPERSRKGGFMLLISRAAVCNLSVSCYKMILKNIDQG